MKTLSLVIPVYNESLRIANILDVLRDETRIKKLNIKEIIFVDDGSTDTTLKILSDFKESYTATTVVILKNKVNRGKGYSVKKGMLAASEDVAVMLDADLSVHIDEIEKIKPMLNNYPIIIGSRANHKSSLIKKDQPLIRQFMGNIFTLINKIIFQLNQNDFTCGFKAFDKPSRKMIFSLSRISRWAYDVEILVIAKMLSYQVFEHGVTWSHKDGSKVKVISSALQSLSEIAAIYLYMILNKYSKSQVAIISNQAHNY